MSRKAILVAVVLVAGLSCLSAGIVLFSTRRAQPSFVRGEVNVRDPFETRDKVDDFSARLERLERGLARLGRPRAAGDREEDEDSASGDGEEEPATLDERVANLEQRFEELALRLEGLEEDPVNRGFTFLASASNELRRDGIRMLGRVARSDPEAREAIRKHLADADAGVRRAAIDALDDLEDKEALPLIADLLADPDRGVRREALDALADIGGRESADILTRVLADDADADMRRRAADALGESRAAGSAGALLRALEDSHPDVRGEAIASLGEIGAKEAAPALRALYDRDPGAHRLRLAESLERLGDPAPMRAETSRLRQTALGGENARDREEAIESLRRIARETSRDVFTQALEDPDPRVRREAGQALRDDDD